MPRQPTVLGFEVENPSELHKGKEHDQPLMLIHKGMATMGASALRLDKAVKQGQEKIDIVGEAWHSHQGTSWEMGVFPKREPDLPTMSSLNAFVHTPRVRSRTVDPPKLSPFAVAIPLPQGWNENSCQLRAQVVQ